MLTSICAFLSAYNLPTDVVPAKAGVQHKKRSLKELNIPKNIVQSKATLLSWIPVFAGTTTEGCGFLAIKQHPHTYIMLHDSLGVK